MRKGITRSKLTKKSQVTIPLMVREKLGVKPGDQVEFLVDEGKSVYVAAAPSLADKFFGIGKKYAKGKKPITDWRKFHEEFETAVAKEALGKMNRK